jgi:hypothetical protein
MSGVKIQSMRPGRGDNFGSPLPSPGKRVYSLPPAAKRLVLDLTILLTKSGHVTCDARLEYLDLDSKVT